MPQLHRQNGLNSDNGDSIQIKRKEVIAITKETRRQRYLAFHRAPSYHVTSVHVVELTLLMLFLIQDPRDGVCFL